jgi:hypothetical protein
VEIYLRAPLVICDRAASAIAKSLMKGDLVFLKILGVGVDDALGGC